MGINKKGVIVGGYTKDGIRHGYVLIDNVYTTLDVPGCSSTIAGGAMTCTTPRKVRQCGPGCPVFMEREGRRSKGYSANPVKVKELLLSEGRKEVR